MRARPRGTPYEDVGVWPEVVIVKSPEEIRIY